MKRLATLILAVVVFFINVTNIEAAKVSENARHIGVVIIGDYDYKTNSGYHQVRDKLNTRKDPNIVIESNGEVQGKYMEYWASKGFLEEQIPNEQDMIDFVKISGYDKVIYIMLGEFNTRREDVSRSSGYVYMHKIVGSVEVESFICDKDNTINSYNATKEDSTSIDKELEHEDEKGIEKKANDLKIFILKKCLREIEGNFADYF